MSLYDICICIGRFQPFHWGHFDLMQTTFNQGKKVIVLLGSHLNSPTLKNPWSAEEREQMIRLSIPRNWQIKTHFIPLCDQATDEQWVTDIHEKVYAITNLNRQISIVGHHDKGQQFFQQQFPHWDYIEKHRKSGINATDIRTAYFSQLPETDYARKIPLGTLQYLRDFRQNPMYRKLCQEFLGQSSTLV